MKMKIPIFQIDAFTEKMFRGNPAAVCPMRAWPKDAVMQAIAAENNLSETAFIVGGQGKYRIRWFTPKAEVDLCGHATLAAGYVVMNHIDKSLKSVKFLSDHSGLLGVSRAGDMLAMDFPSVPAKACAPPASLVQGLRSKGMIATLETARDYMAVFETEAQVRRLKPDFAKLRRLGKQGIIATAKGDKVDFVSRFFAPKLGIDEDPVTGSAHCTLTPFWSKLLKQDRLVALQVSPRGGEILCMQKEDRVFLAGHAVLYMRGAVEI
jgi:predicted PhzF superfamily epimerase YddE/YHI9